MALAAAASQWAPRDSGDPDVLTIATSDGTSSAEARWYISTASGSCSATHRALPAMPTTVLPSNCWPTGSSPGPLPQRQRLADDDAVRVAGLQAAAAQDRNLQRGEECRRDVVDVDVDLSSSRLGPGDRPDGRQAAAWTSAPRIPRQAARQAAPAARPGRPGPNPTRSRVAPAPDRSRSRARSRSPGLAVIARSSARTSSPATMSRTQLAATCAPIRHWRSRLARWR